MSNGRDILYTIVTLTIALLVLSCDDYNVVEPRFYSEDDVVDIEVCEWVTVAERPDRVVTTALDVSDGEPAVFGTGACWENQDAQTLLVGVSMPQMGQLEVSILNSGGGLESMLFSDKVTAGLFHYTWVAKQDGVYAISVQATYAGLVIWFEVN